MSNELTKQNIQDLFDRHSYHEHHMVHYFDRMASEPSKHKMEKLEEKYKYYLRRQRLTAQVLAKRISLPTLYGSISEKQNTYARGLLSQKGITVHAYTIQSLTIIEGLVLIKCLNGEDVGEQLDFYGGLILKKLVDKEKGTYETPMIEPYEGEVRGISKNKAPVIPERHLKPKPRVPRKPRS